MYTATRKKTGAGKRSSSEPGSKPRRKSEGMMAAAYRMIVGSA
jgi:hypothetical protein